MGTIPISQIISTTPSVLGAGGAGISFNGLLLTNSTAVPIGSVPSFPSAAAVASYFGATSTEATLAAIYFQGYTKGTKTPAALLMAQYPSAVVAGYLRGGNISGLSLTALKALSGTLTITVGGTAQTSGTINLSAATSFSSAATIIQAGFTSPPFTVSYSSQFGAFVFTNTATGASSTITFATGTLATGLALTQATGAVTSQGAAAATPIAFMQSLIGVSQAWTNFATTWEPVDADKISFAQWVSQQANRYAYAMWDSDAAPTQTGDTSSAGYQIIQAGYGGTVPIYSTDATEAAFVLGTAASIDTGATNGRITFAFKSGTGLTPKVTDATTAANLEANGYNFYGAYAEATTDFDFFYPGSVTGQYSWLDSYENQIWLNSQFRIQLATLLTSVNSIPYNSAGYTLIREALKTTITAAINFGAIRQGVSLSSTQAAEVNNAAGIQIDQTLSTAGYYLLIQDASAEVRAARGTPPMTFWYMDGESVQSINLASIMIQ